MFIKQLDKNLSNMIAAGEVVERPASAVKELCENSIDAGASVITVEVRGGGTKLIKVTDNGCGIHPDDVENAFMRHATSKISTPEDLNKIYTLGFRGEALASIAAVARVSLYTRTAEFEEGMQCNANYGEISDASATPGFVGTSIRVEDLFYTTPARLKFLKKDATETGYIEEVVRKCALAHPEVSFRFIADDKERLFTPGDGNLKNAVFTIYGKEASSQLEEVDYKDDNIHITGLVSNPVYAKKTRSMQMFFINNRPVVSRMLASALEEAYKNLVPQAMHPIGIIKIAIPPETVDINVHPAKLEVKFSDESRIYRAVYWGVKNAVTAKFVPKMTQTETAEPQPQMMPKQDIFAEAKDENDRTVVLRNKSDMLSFAENFVAQPPKQRAFESVLEFGDGSRRGEETRMPVQNSPVIETKERKATEVIQLGEKMSSDADFTVIGQAFCTYILVERGNEILMIDQHAAHEHITYANLKKQAETDKIQPQSLLMPQVVTLSPAEKAFVLDNAKFFEEIGFETDDFGNNDIVVRAVPEAMELAEIEPMLTELIQNASDNKIDTATEKKNRALYTVACRASIKAGKRLDISEMKNIAEMLFEADKTVTCPHGRPAWVVMDKTFIEKQFKRLM